jgi:hypothetical protein
MLVSENIYISPDKKVCAVQIHEMNYEFSTRNWFRVYYDGLYVRHTDTRKQAIALAKRLEVTPYIGKLRWYVGISPESYYKREAFSSRALPTQASHGDKYVVVIGPCITKRGALWLVEHTFYHFSNDMKYVERMAKLNA